MSKLPSLTLLVLLLIQTGSVFGQRRIDMNLEGQMASAIIELQEKMDADPDIKGRKLRLGRFTGPNLPDSNFDMEFENLIKQRMSKLLAEESDLVLNGTYQILPGEQSENKDLIVIQIRMTITRKFRTLQSVTREINRSSDISRITGSTVSLPDTNDLEKRNKAAEKGITDPTFALKDKFWITTKSGCNYAVAIKKKSKGSGAAQFVVPKNINGFAFVDLKVTDTFSILAYNLDSENDAVANVSIDGLNVASTFCTDSNKPKGYVIWRKTKSGRPTTVEIPGWIKTTKSRKNNVFQFVVNKLGQGAATEMNSRHRIGVIHIDFFEAVKESEAAKIRKRSFGEVGKGRPLDVNYKVIQMVKRDTPTASISIRYNNPRK